MLFELVRHPFLLHSSITPRLSVVKHHRLLEQLKALDLFDGSLGSFRIVEDNESLAFRFQVFLGYYVDDGTIFGEDLRECLFEWIDFDALL